MDQRSVTSSEVFRKARPRQRSPARAGKQRRGNSNLDLCFPRLLPPILCPFSPTTLMNVSQRAGPCVTGGAGRDRLAPKPGTTIAGYRHRHPVCAAVVSKRKMKQHISAAAFPEIGKIGNTAPPDFTVRNRFNKPLRPTWAENRGHNALAPPFTRTCRSPRLSDPPLPSPDN